MSSQQERKSVLESLMFVWGDPLSVKEAAEVLNIAPKEAYTCFKELQQEYLERGCGIQIREINKKFQFCTKAENSSYIERFCTPVKEKRLSQSAMEVLAIIAYKQPVTRGEIESVRGIRCERVIEGLQKKGLIQEVGRSAAIGRPILYGTTDVFLQHFDLESIQDLPEIEDIEAVIQLEGDADQPAFQQISIDLEQK